MKMTITPALLVMTFLLAGAAQAEAQHSVMSDEELMADLKGAAPPNVVEHATIMNMGSDNKMKVVREGNNGWTCMDPGGGPMCADKAAMEWAQAYAKEETADNNWVKTGPHVMIVGAPQDMMQAYPRDAKPDPTKPYVMWPGTPYEHLMLPVQ